MFKVVDGDADNELTVGERTTSEALDEEGGRDLDGEFRKSELEANTRLLGEGPDIVLVSGPDDTGGSPVVDTGAVAPKRL